MPAHKMRSTANGGREKLKVEPSRCLRMRFDGSCCDRCTAACTRSAITLEEGLAVDPALCSSCLICTAVCPSGALEHAGDFTSIAAKLARISWPVLGCARSADCSHAAIHCLVGLSKEHLIYLLARLPNPLTLNLTGCASCGNESAIGYLRERLDALEGDGLTKGGCRISLVERAEELSFRAESVDRRGFFQSLRTIALRGVAEVIGGEAPPPESGGSYSEKALPARRRLLNASRELLPPDARIRLEEAFDCHLTVNDACDACQACAAICPTGALQSDLPDSHPSFDPLSCTGCALCVEFCTNGALSLRQPIRPIGGKRAEPQSAQASPIWKPTIP